MTNIRSRKHTEISEINKTKLAGRIYPAIQNCVGNRYKIVAGYFAIAGYVLFDDQRLGKFVSSGADLVTALIFTMFVAHDFINYRDNAKEQWGIENENPSARWSPCKELRMEYWWTAFMLLLILGGLWWLRCLFAALPLKC